MGDWSDFMEACGGRIPRDIASAQMLPGYYRKARRADARTHSRTIAMTKDEAAKFKALGGVKWFRKALAEATPPSQQAATQEPTP